MTHKIMISMMERIKARMFFNILAHMLGTIVNVITVLVGGSIGLIINNKLPDRYVKIFFQVIGLFTLSLGFSMSIKTTHMLHVVVALITGSIIGEALSLDQLMEGLGDKLIYNDVKLEIDLQASK